MPQFSSWFRRIDATTTRTLDEVQGNLQTTNALLADIKSLLERVAFQLANPRGAVKLLFDVTIDGVLRKGVEDVLIKASQEFDVSVTFQDAQGNPAGVQGVPTWTNSNEAVVTMTVAADGLSAVISAVGTPGTGQISVKADADLTDSEHDIIGTLDVEVVAGDAVVVQLNTANVRDKTTPAPPAPPAP